MFTAANNCHKVNQYLRFQQKLFKTPGILLDFSPAHFNHWKLRYSTSVPGDHGTNVPNNRTS